MKCMGIPHRIFMFISSLVIAEISSRVDRSILVLLCDPCMALENSSIFVSA